MSIERLSMPNEQGVEFQAGFLSRLKNIFSTRPEVESEPGHVGPDVAVAHGVHIESPEQIEPKGQLELLRIMPHRNKDGSIDASHPGYEIKSYKSSAMLGQE